MRVTYRWTREKCRYGLDRGSFQDFDKFLVIADISTLMGLEADILVCILNHVF
jgi:hypothetical protein